MSKQKKTTTKAQNKPEARIDAKLKRLHDVFMDNKGVESVYQTDDGEVFFNESHAYNHRKKYAKYRREVVEALYKKVSAAEQPDDENPKGDDENPKGDDSDPGSSDAGSEANKDKESSDSENKGNTE